MISTDLLNFTSLISTIIVSISAVVVALIAIYGVFQWKRELKGKSQFELARQIVKLAMEYRDNYHAVRSPITYSIEYANREKAADETNETSQILDEWHAKIKRMEKLNKIILQLHEASWEAEILLSEELPKYILPIEETYNDLGISIRSYFNSQLLVTKQHIQRDDIYEKQQEHNDHIYGMPDDKYGKEVDLLIDKLVSKIKLFIQR